MWFVPRWRALELSCKRWGIDWEGRGWAVPPQSGDVMWIPAWKQKNSPVEGLVKSSALSGEPSSPMPYFLLKYTK